MRTKKIRAKYHNGVFEPLEPMSLPEDKVVEVILPVEEAAREVADDDAAFLSSAGGWSDLDAEKFIRETYERRRLGSRPPVQL
jgi:predicted DNA-binding antitoxin AbrB/MazE fold protein